MKKWIIAGIVGILLLTGVGLYYLLGGFKDIEFHIEERENIELVGLTYRGTPRHDKIEETFNRVHQLIAQYPQARLHTLYEVEPGGKRDTLEVFVGIENLDIIAPRDGLEEKNIRCSKIIVANIKAHRLVMPLPSVVKRKIEAYAEKMGVVTQGIYIDVILNDRHVKVIAPLKS